MIANKTITTVLVNIFRLKIRKSPLKSFLFFNCVSNSPYGLYKFRIFCVFFQFFPQSAYMSHHCIVVVQIFFTPYSFKQLFRRDNFTLIFAQIPYNGKLCRSQRQCLSVQRTFVLFLVYNKSSDIVFRYFFGFIFSVPEPIVPCIPP